jgi:hypothetical protein
MMIATETGTSLETVLLRASSPLPSRSNARAERQRIRRVIGRQVVTI